MRIVLAEERDGLLLPEQTFEGPVVAVGRDARRCQFSFNQAEWRMVSRMHAEFRWEDGRCLLVDNDSTYGTFLDGKALDAPAEVSAGARVRFGIEGPVLVVSHLAGSAAPGGDAEPAAAPAPRHDPSPPPSHPPPSPPPPVTVLPGAHVEAVIHLGGEDGAPSGRYQLAGEVVRIGRDPRMELVVGASSTVSRHHAEIRRSGDHFLLADANSFNGTLLNGERIAHAVPLYDGDQIQLGLHGPVLTFDSPAHPPRGGVRPAAGAAAAQPQPEPPPDVTGDLAPAQPEGHVTTTFSDPKADRFRRRLTRLAAQRPIIQRAFKSANSVLSVGRDAGNDLCLEGLQISARHALIERRGAEVFVEDRNSTNGVYVNGARVSQRRLEPADVVQIGSFVLCADAAHGVRVFDTRANMRLDVAEVSLSVPGRPGGPAVTLLDGVSLSVEPNEFVGLLGPSGAGKSTLLGAMNGMRRPSKGRVLVNSLDLYDHLDSLKQQIGYIPQDDISHRELTVYRTLHYVAQLRLSRDVTQLEIDDLINDILDVTELTEQRGVHLCRLSGGQRKRVSIAVEMVTKPSAVFLDEPTSGLDPVNARRIMRLFRHIAEGGRTVLMTTHLMEDVHLFHKVAILVRGRLAFYGTPQEALEYFGVGSFKEVFERLEPPAGEPGGEATSPAAFADVLKSRFRKSDLYARYVAQPPDDAARAAPPQSRRPSPYEQLLQWAILARRYMEVSTFDRTSLLILLAQAPIIGLLTFIAVRSDAARDFPYFVLALVAMWFGTSTAAREIVKERAVYARERMVNTMLLPYVGSKLFVLLLVVGSQCVLLFGTLKALHYLGLWELPGRAFPQLLVMILTGLCGVALGLLISAAARTSEVATSIVPLVLIPQILFAGLVGVPAGASKAVGLAMPTTWAFDELKILSGLPVLRGAEGGGRASERADGRGLYGQIEEENEAARHAFEEYESRARGKLEEFEQRVADYQKEMERFANFEVADKPARPDPPRLEPPPGASVKTPPKDLSGYVSYLHPSGGGALNALVLVALLLLLTGATVLTLKRQDVC